MLIQLMLMLWMRYWTVGLNNIKAWNSMLTWEIISFSGRTVLNTMSIEARGKTRESLKLRKAGIVWDEEKVRKNTSQQELNCSIRKASQSATLTGVLKRVFGTSAVEEPRTVWHYIDRWSAGNGRWWSRVRQSLHCRTVNTQNCS
jgi:hypothetical protein